MHVIFLECSSTSWGNGWTEKKGGNPVSRKRGSCWPSYAVLPPILLIVHATLPPPHDCSSVVDMAPVCPSAPLLSSHWDGTGFRRMHSWSWGSPCLGLVRVAAAQETSLLSRLGSTTRLGLLPFWLGLSGPSICHWWSQIVPCHYAGASGSI
jgi:hypothetical protein